MSSESHLQAKGASPFSDCLSLGKLTKTEPNCQQVLGIVHAPIPLPSDVFFPTHTTKCYHNPVSCIDACLRASPISAPSEGVLPGIWHNLNQSIDQVGNREEVSTIQIPERWRIRLASAYYAYFLCGWGDGVTGTVFPYFVRDYHLSYMTASVIFVTSTLGFSLGTLSLERLIGILGRFYIRADERSFVPVIPRLSRIGSSHRSRNPTGHSKSQARLLILVLSSILHVSFFVIMGSKSGYSTLLLAYAFAALARSYLTSTLNAYVSLMPNKPHGFLLGFWSFGAFISPIFCQTLVAKGFSWANFYFGSLVVPALNVCLLAYAFKPTRKEFENDRRSALEFLETANPDVPPDTAAAGRTKTSSCSFMEVDAPFPVNTLKRALSMTYQWLFSIIAWIYSGNETTTQGFIVTYLLVVRHADVKTVGYVTSGYWAGQTIARFMWGYYTASLSFTQRKHIIHACITSMLAMQLLIWFVHSNVENAFSTAFIGFASGPLFPGTLRLANEVLPSDVHMVSMAIISSFASFGSALFPFITGTISNLKGPHVLTYVTVAQTGVLFCLWSLFPSKVPSKTTRV